MRGFAFVAATVLALLLPLVSGCGGGGGGGGGGGVNLTLSPMSATVGGNGRVVMAAIVTGTQNGNVTWSASIGTIVPTGPGSATFTAPPGAASASVTATSVANPSATRTATINVVPGMATVSGRVRQNSTTFGVPGVVIEIRDAAQAVLATVTTGSTGYFSIAVPLNAARFHLRNNSIPPGYYKVFGYNLKRYSTLIATCSAPLPAVSADAHTTLLTDVVLHPTFEPPPPPPTGCE